MKKFLKYITLLIVITIAFLYLLELLYTHTYKNGIPRNKVSYVLSMNDKYIDYIFLGSSRVDNTIDAEVIEKITGKKALNLGIQAAKLNDLFFMLKLLQKQNIKSEIVFIQVDYIYNMEGNSEILKSYLMPYIKDDVISSYIKERDSNYYKLKYIPFYRYLVFDYKLGFREHFNTFINKKSRINFENGYDAKYGSTGVKLQASLPKTVNKENKTITAINQFAKENNIKVVYFMAPFCFDTANKDFSQKLKQKIPGLLDYSQLFKDDNYFFNPGHLNDKGAKEFSKRMALDILKQEINQKN
ncbi:MAG: hypothetical protein JJE44_02370 [Flavobacteriaceae bacterium]|nr:hypothetical protein [Flavobacteriaceae bacterium]